VSSGNLEGNKWLRFNNLKINFWGGPGAALRCVFAFLEADFSGIYGRFLGFMPSFPQH
jgi:hypothetical protein